MTASRPYRPEWRLVDARNGARCAECLAFVVGPARVWNYYATPTTSTKSVCEGCADALLAEEG